MAISLHIASILISLTCLFVVNTVQNNVFLHRLLIANAYFTIVLSYLNEILGNLGILIGEVTLVSVLYHIIIVLMLILNENCLLNLLIISLHLFIVISIFCLYK